MNNDNQKTGKTFIGVSAVIFVAKLLGFTRDIVFAFIFGTSILTDVFQAVFSLPSLFFSSIGTALSAINIPDLTYFITNRTKKERDEYISRLFAQITLWATIIAVAGIIFAPTLAKLIAPGLEGEANRIAVLLTRVMMPTLLFVSLTFVTTGILQVHGYFLRAAAISIPFNILIIAALVFKGGDILFLGYVTTTGWLLQFLIQLPVLAKENYQFSRVKLKTRYTLKVFSQLLPILMGNSLLQLCLIIDRSFGTHLEPGTTSALSFGGNLFVTVTSIFIVAMSSVVFPRLSRYCLDKDYAQIRAMLQYIFKILMFILLPYLILVVAYHQQIIALVYERGAFTSHSTMITATAFLCYSFAVVGYACQEIFNRVYYALKKFKIPMIASIICLTVNVVLDLLFLESGIIAISTATALSMLLYAIIMSIMVSREIGGFLTRNLASFSLKLMLPAAGMLAVILSFRQLPFDGMVLSFLLPLTLSGLLYLGIAHLSGLTRIFNLREAS